jgi:hypothetical protein
VKNNNISKERGERKEQRSDYGRRRKTEYVTEKTQEKTPTIFGETNRNPIQMLNCN